MKTIKVKLTFTEPLLGTWPANPNVAREYIASKGPDASTIEDEVAALGADAAALAVVEVKFAALAVRYRNGSVRAERCAQQALLALLRVPDRDVRTPFAGDGHAGGAARVDFAARGKLLPRGLFIDILCTLCHYPQQML